MSTKVKIIIIAAAALFIIAFVTSFFIYVNYLNNKVTELETVTVEQNNTIEALQNNIDSLKNNLESYHETINVINSYIENVEKLKSDESAIKQAVYEEVISNPDSLEWFNEKLPDNIASIINDRAADGMCNN